MSYLQDINSLLSTQELLLITTASKTTFHLRRVLNFDMQSHLGVLRLKAIAMVTLLLGTDEFMHGIQPPLPILDRLGPLELVLRVFHGDTTAMEAHAAQGLEYNVEEPIVIDWTSQLDMAKVSRIRLVMEVPETRVVDATVDGLPCHVRLF